MANITQMLSSVWPAVKLIMIVLIGVSFAIGLGYYFLIIKRRKKWFIRVHELSSDGRLHVIGFDELIERRFDNGRVIMYWLSKNRQETTPPPTDAVDMVNNKRWADYLRIRHTYVPIIKKPEQGTKQDMYKMPDLMSRATTAIKTSPEYRMGTFARPDKVEQRFVYVPINKVPHINIGYHQMDYDVDVMRINAIDNIDKMFSSQKTFWEKYGMYVMIGFLVVAIIVVAYMSFEYMRDVISKNLEQTSAVVNAIKGLQIGGGGAPPV